MARVIEVQDDGDDFDGDQDAEFLSLLDALEADALAASAPSNKRQKVSSVGDGGRGAGAGVKIEGPYAAALRGSVPQQQQGKPRENSSSFAVSAGGAVAAGVCFKCGVSGHWARDCPGGAAGGGGGIGRGGSAGGEDVAEKQCPCGMGSCLVLTSNTAKNPGRKFYRCPMREENGGCNFFEWCDSPSAGLPTSGRASTEGRGTYSFSNWSSEPSSIPHQSQFSSQAKSTYSSNYSGTQSSGERNASACFKCGQEGHWARDCPRSSLSDPYADAGGGRPAPSASGQCFKCGQAGHWARDCAAQDSGAAGARDRKASHSSRAPFANKYT